MIFLVPARPAETSPVEAIILCTPTGRLVPLEPRRTKKAIMAMNRSVYTKKNQSPGPNGIPNGWSAFDSTLKKP